MTRMYKVEIVSQDSWSDIEIVYPYADSHKEAVKEVVDTYNGYRVLSSEEV